MSMTFWSGRSAEHTAQSIDNLSGAVSVVALSTLAPATSSRILLLLAVLCADGANTMAMAAELAPKGAYVSTEITCADFNAGNGNAMSLVEVDGMRFSSGKAYCDMSPTVKRDVFRAVCRAYPLPGGASASADVIEFEGEKAFQWVPPDTIVVDGERRFRRCVIMP